MRRFLLATTMALVTYGAQGQGVPNGLITDGSAWTPDMWNNAWRSKQDINNPTGVAAFGGLTITLPLSGMFAVAPMSATTIPSYQGQVTNTLTSSASGGTLGQTRNIEFNSLTLTGAPNEYWWVGLDVLYWNGTGGTGQHVARYAQTNRYTYAAGGAANNPQLWAGVFECNDFTQQPSVNTNVFQCMEIDQKGSGLDFYGRYLQVGVLAPDATVGAPGYFVAEGYTITANPGAYAVGGYGFGGSYVDSVADWRYACGFAVGQLSLSTCVMPTVASTTTSSTSLPVTNVIPFIRDYLGRDLNSFHTSTNIWVNGVQYSITAYTITGSGATPAGTLTLSAPLSATIGQTVNATSNIIWLPTGARIGLDTGAATQIYSDAVNVHVVGGLISTGPHFFPTYTVAGLPACSGQQNAMAVVTDATAPTYRGTLTGGGAVRTPVFCDGTSWTSH